MLATTSTFEVPEVTCPPDENTLRVFVPCVTSAPEVNDIVVAPIPTVNLFEKAVTGFVLGSSVALASFAFALTKLTANL